MKKYLTCLLSICLTVAHAQTNPPGGFKNFYDFQKSFNESEKEKSSAGIEGEEYEDGAYERFKRTEWYLQPRLYPSGNWINTFDKSLQAEQEIKSQFRSSNGRWQACGPNSINAVISAIQGIGRVNRIVFGQSGALYAGTAQGGLWKRVGSTWTCLTNFIPALSVSGIAINPLDENVIYILTGDADENEGTASPDYFSRGVLKTDDGGLSWYQTGYNIAWPQNTVQASTPFAGYKIVEHPSSPNILMIASNVGIIRTIDSGLTWDTVATDPGSRGFFDIEMKPDNSNIWYACTNNKVWRSTNAGATWSTPHASNSINADGNVSRTCIEVSAASPSIVYVLCAGDGTPQNGFIRLVKSTNGSGTFSFSTVCDFTNTLNIFSNNYSGTGNTSQANYDCAFAVNPSDANQMFVGGINVWYNGNGGAAASWSLGSYWSPDAGTAVDRMHGDIHDIIYHGGDLFVANDGGVNYQDIGALDPNWDVWYAGLNITQFYSLELDPTNPNGHTLLGAQDNGELLYDGDDNFQLLWGGDGGEALVDPTDNNRYYFYLNTDLLKDGCDLCWPGSDAPYPGCGCADESNPGGSWVGNRALEVNPLNNLSIYSGWTCLFRTDNGGSNWGWQSSIPCDGNTIVDLDFDASNRLWVTKWNSVFRQNASGSGSFTNVTSNLPVATASLTGLACSNANSNVAFVCFSGFVDGQKVYMTIDGGASWSNISGLLPNIPVNCIVYEANSNDALYIGTDIGVFYSDNDVTIWTPFRNGMPSVAVTDLEISTVDNMLYAATYGRGLWKSDLFSGCQSGIKILGGILSTDGYVGPFQYTSGYYTYRSIDSTVVDMPLTAGLGQNVTMISEGYIKLKEGFEVKNNSEFRAFYYPFCFSGFYSNLKGEYAGEMIPEKNPEESINEIPVQVSVYPNPFVDELKMGVLVSDDEEPLRVFFTDLSGKSISVPYKQATYDGQTIGFTFNTSELTDGAYIITVRSGNFSQTKKVIKLSAK